MTAFSNLVKTFQLENDPDVLKQLQKFVREQMREIFNLKYTYVQQLPEIHIKFLRRVRERFPRLFENNDTRSDLIRVVNQYAMRTYSRERCRILLRAPRETMSMSIERSLSREKPKSPQPPAPKVRSTGVSLNAPRKATRMGRTSNTIDSYFDSIGTSTRSGHRTSPILIDLPSSSPQTSLSNDIPANSSSQFKFMHPTSNGPRYRINEVENFLSTCVPNMRHLLNSFLDYGIRNREILFVIATQWSDEELENLLKGVFQRAVAPTEAGGVYNSDLVPEVDIQILKKHFKRAFISGNSHQIQ